VRIQIYAPGAPLESDVVVIPPGLSGERAPAALEALRAHACRGGLLLGLGDGVAWLCAAELLPGTLTEEESHAPATHVRVEGCATPFTWAIPAGRIVALAPFPSTPRYAAPDSEILALAARGRIVLRYCDASGGVTRPREGGHAATAAGIADESGRVVGLVAPATPSLDTELGRQLLTCLRGRPRGAVQNQGSPTQVELGQEPPA
jgi:phosphoribosylformylglycinamidine (FGAM) synthase-like amidotransferase family enzyme